MSEMMLVTGGARSGKSSFAEKKLPNIIVFYMWRPELHFKMIQSFKLG